MKIFMKILNKLFLVLAFSGLTACVGDLDFDQVNDFETTQVNKVSLINFEFDTQDIEFDLEGPLDASDQLNLEGIPNRNLERVVFEFEASNTFDDDFILNITLLGPGEDYVFDTITVTANTPIVDIAPVEIDLIANPEVLFSDEIIGEIVYTGSITANDPGALSFASAGTFYYRIK